MSVRCNKSELDLFSLPPQQFEILNTQEVIYHPVNSITESPRTIEFLSLGSGDSYRDLSSIYLRLRVKLVKNDKNEAHTNTTAAPATASVVNGLFFALFKQASLHLNNVPISQASNDYAYRAFFTTLINYGNDSSSTHLESIGWSLDKGKVEAQSADNPGFLDRQIKMAGSKTIEFFGPLYMDLCNQNRLLLNNVDVRIVLTLQNPGFYILEPEKGTSLIKIENCQLFMNHIQLNPHTLLSNEMRLSKQMAVYPYQRVEVKTHTIPNGGRTLSIDNVIIGIFSFYFFTQLVFSLYFKNLQFYTPAGQLPNLLLFAMVDNDSFTGASRLLNPFNLKHNNISSFQLLVNGMPVPATPLDFDYSQDPPISTRGYQTLFRGTGIHYFDRGHQITKKYFDNGCFLVAIDLTADHSQDSLCVNPSNSGTIRIEAQFKEPLPKTTTCIVYTSYDSILKIDKQRNIYTQF